MSRWSTEVLRLIGALEQFACPGTSRGENLLSIISSRRVAAPLREIIFFFSGSLRERALPATAPRRSARIFFFFHVSSLREIIEKAA